MTVNECYRVLNLDYDATMKDVKKSLPREMQGAASRRERQR